MRPVRRGAALLFAAAFVFIVLTACSKGGQEPAAAAKTAVREANSDPAVEVTTV